MNDSDRIQQLINSVRELTLVVKEVNGFCDKLQFQIKLQQEQINTLLNNIK